MVNELVHKPVDLAKVRAATRKVLTTPGFLAQHYMALRKYDGVCGIIEINAAYGIDGAWDDWRDVVTIKTRTGEEIKSCDHIRKEIFTRFKDHHGGGHVVLFVELWAPGLEFNVISGLARRHEPAFSLTYRVWDCVCGAEYRDGISYRPFTERLASARKWLPLSVMAETYNPGTYGDPQTLADLLVGLGGYDGLILADPNGRWVRGPGTGGEKIKIKRKLEYTLRVRRTEPGKGKHEGRIGALVVMFYGKELRVGTGLSDADRERDDWVGKLVEVQAMDKSSEGLLREPRLKGVRTDKEFADDEQAA